MGTVIVTTPQDVSVLDVKKAIRMFQTVNVPILGLVENMAWFTPPGSTERYHLFGSGGGKKIEAEFGTPILGQHLSRLPCAKAAITANQSSFQIQTVPPVAPSSRSPAKLLNESASSTQNNSHEPNQERHAALHSLQRQDHDA